MDNPRLNHNGRKAMDRRDMIAALRTVFVPALIARGFRGPFPHFRRISKQQIDILTVQFNRHGESFVLEIARCDAAGETSYWGKHIAPTKVRSWDIAPNKRHRLGANSGKAGRWFRFDDGTPVQEVAVRAVSYLGEADTWWASSSYITE